MPLFKKIIAYVVLALQVLLLILLIFEKRIEVPAPLQAIGRVHPLMLHLPIGLLLITTVIAFGQKLFSQTYDELVTFLLHVSALTASLSAFMGMLLSFEGGYDSVDLDLHKWLGVALSFFTWLLISFEIKEKQLRPFLLVATVVLVATGHFGASLTHGSGFILEPLAKSASRIKVITDSSTLFSASIEPILEAKCYSCHNEQKSKGRLILTSEAHIIRGGKNGALWTNSESLMLHRLHLPLEDKKHMPPKDKAQLSKDEVSLIENWIELGGNFQTKLNDLKEEDTIRLLANKIINQYYGKDQTASIYKFASASAEDIHKLNTPYRTVFKLGANEPALQVDFFLATAFQSSYLDELKVIREQIVVLNLSKMPVSDKDLKTLTQFVNLEKLILNQTGVEKDLSTLNSLPKLRTLSLAGTKVKVEAVRALAGSKTLKEVYLWNTNVSEAEAQGLRREAPPIDWQVGYTPDEKEVLQLSAPILRNDGQVLQKDERVSFKHNLPGAVIRYSVNGEMPDSVSGSIYNEAIGIENYSIVKTKAFKEGWRSSKGYEYVFFVSGFKPDRATLLTKPEPRYPGEGATTLIDTRKGMPDFYRDPVWMGFRNDKLEAVFYFDNEIPTISNITLSYARNIGAMSMPPAEVQIWAGDDEKKLKLIASVKPSQPTGYVSTRIEGTLIEFPKSAFRCYKLIAKPLAKLPPFRKAPGEKGWLMVDELFFN